MDPRIVDETAQRLLEAHMATGDVSGLREAGNVYDQSKALQEMVYSVAVVGCRATPQTLLPIIRGAVIVALQCGSVATLGTTVPTFTPN
jgi:hypothetical protein